MMDNLINSPLDQELSKLSPFELKGRIIAMANERVKRNANTMLNDQAMKVIVAEMKNPKVGCVAGEKRVMARDDKQSAAEGEGLYW